MRMGAVSTPLAIRFNIIFIGATTFDRMTLRRTAFVRLIGIRMVQVRATLATMALARFTLR
jgi:hypothetical protein